MYGSMYGLGRSRMVPPVYWTRSNLRRTQQASTFNWPSQSKFDVVARAFPHASSSRGCSWRRVTSPSGRKMWEPVK